MKSHVALAASVGLAAACSSGSPATPAFDAASPLGAGASAWDAASWNEDAPIPEAGDTWSSFMQGFFEKYCVECHAPGNPNGNDFTQLSNVQRQELIIRCGIAVTQDPSWHCSAIAPGVSPAQFPIDDATHSNPKPSDAERARVVAWIDAGGA